MSSLKRKMANYPVSSVPNKRLLRAESSSLVANGVQREAGFVGAAGKSFAENQNLGLSEAEKVQGRQLEQDSKDPEPMGGDNSLQTEPDKQGTLTSENNVAASGVLPHSRAVTERGDQEGKTNADSADNGELSPGDMERDLEETGDKELVHQKKAHLIPNHAGWFSWNAIHLLEQRGVPEFFNGKSKIKTPELYMEYRNLIMNKFLENPEKLLTIADLSTFIPRNRDACRRIFDFLNHWGLINYLAFDHEKVQPSGSPVVQFVEKKEATLQGDSQITNSLESLYRFDLPKASLPEANAVASKKVPSPTLVEATMPDVLFGSQGPAVEYHCNSCSTDCSKRRYHCQKQADFDLCPECYNDGKFNFGMGKGDFILMEALPEAMDTTSGGWTDQETLLLLEALELCGDNWDMISEHVATKTKAQCILHFIQLLIEDPFLESMETSSNISTISSLPDSISANKISLKGDDQVGASNNLLNESLGQKAPEDGTLPPSKDNDETAVIDDKKKNEELKVASAINDAIQAAGMCGSDTKPLAFVDAGNPVMALVAFLAALVGPDIAATSAQAALQVLSDRDPIIQLAIKHSFTLGAQELKDDGAKVLFDSAEIGEISSPNEETVPADASVPPVRILTTIECDGNGSTSGIEDRVEGDPCIPTLVQSTGTVEADVKCPEGSKILTEGSKLLTEGSKNLSLMTEKKGSLDKIKNAAATALTAAAVKAKLLADQEEQEILQLAASVVNSQLKKLGIKLKLYRELEILLSRESDQVEKSRQRLLTERSQIISSHFNTSTANGPLQGPSSTSCKMLPSASVANLGYSGSALVSSVVGAVTTPVTRSLIP